jgi:hypothetical protein
LKDLPPSLALLTTADTHAAGIIFQSPLLAMDDILDSGSGSICYRNLRSAIAKGIREAMVDPEIDMFCNLWQMTVDKIERFDPKLGGIVEEIDGGLVRNNNAKDGHVNRTKKKRTDCIENRCRYKIGKYELSTYYCQFLSDKIICTPLESSCSVRVMTEHISWNLHSIFCSWFCMPLCKVVEIADCFISEG